MLPRHGLVIAALASVVACGDKKDEAAAPRVASQPADKKDDGKAAGADGGGAAGPVAPDDLARASTAAPVTAKGQDHLGFKLDELGKQYALAGVVRTPSWGDAGNGTLAVVRDDDIDTTWSCNADGTRVCALGLAFTEPVELTAVRLFAAAGPKWNTYKAHARPKKVRVHTDAGWVEAKLDDRAKHN